jgi:hypothetical protein
MNLTTETLKLFGTGTAACEAVTQSPFRFRKTWQTSPDSAALPIIHTNPATGLRNNTATVLKVKETVSPQSGYCCISVQVRLLPEHTDRRIHNRIAHKLNNDAEKHHSTRPASTAGPSLQRHQVCSDTRSAATPGLEN